MKNKKYSDYIVDGSNFKFIANYLKFAKFGNQINI